jgi:hypothetical protein
MRRKAKKRQTPIGSSDPPAQVLGLERERTREEAGFRQGTGPVLSGGDVDADWERADSVGEEGVGGTVATPDQDVVDEIGRALGVEQASDAEVRSSEELLRDRDRRRWQR